DEEMTEIGSLAGNVSSRASSSSSSSSSFSVSSGCLARSRSSDLTAGESLGFFGVLGLLALAIEQVLFCLPSKIGSPTANTRPPDRSGCSVACSLRQESEDVVRKRPPAFDPELILGGAQKNDLDLAKD